MKGNIDDMIAAFTHKHYKLVKRLGRDDAIDERIILQSKEGRFGKFSLVTGSNKEGETETIMFFDALCQAGDRRRADSRRQRTLIRFSGRRETLANYTQG